MFLYVFLLNSIHVQASYLGKVYYAVGLPAVSVVPVVGAR